ncbi:MAG: hypothetical protein JSV92_01240 [archaeon]|nr:MAG: hypothetical protein JSV92_01240 [archaeon]
MKRIRPLIRNFNEECPICNLLRGDDQTDLIYDGDFFSLYLNQRVSPHLFRTAIVPYEHCIEKGKYGLECLSKKERDEYRNLKMGATDAIIMAAKKTENVLKEREGQPLIDYLVRPSVHPSGDLIPQYEGMPKLEVKKLGRVFNFPVYGTINLRHFGSFNLTPPDAIVGSFPKSNEGLIMPEEVREEQVRLLKKRLRKRL